MSIITEQSTKMKFAKKYEGYEIVPHPEHKRLYHIVLNQQLLKQFFEEVKEHSEQSLQYIPYSRFMTVKRVDLQLGYKVKRQIQQTT